MSKLICDIEIFHIDGKIKIKNLVNIQSVIDDDIKH